MERDIMNKEKTDCYEIKTEFYSVTSLSFISLTIVTLGLFPFVWWFMNFYKLLERKCTIKLPKFLFWIAAFVMTVAFPIYGHYVLEELRQRAEEGGYFDSMTPGVAMFLISITFISIIVFHLTLWRICDHIPLTTIFNMITFLLGGFVMVDYVHYSDLVNQGYTRVDESVTDEQ